MTTSEKAATYGESNLIWIDMEMTGLQPEVNRVIEIAAVITDPQLNILHEGPVIAIHQDEYTMTHMDAWNTSMHTRSGLVKRVLESTVDEEKATALCRPESLRCAATPSDRTVALWRAGCRVWKPFFTTEASMFRH